MKLISCVLMLGFSFSAFAQLSVSEQTALVEGIAKNDRRKMWQQGMTSVTSLVSRASKRELDEIIRVNKDNAQPLSKDEIGSIYSCHNRPAACVVYVIHYAGEMYGDWGTTRRWVLLSPTTGKYRSLFKEVYSE